MTEEFREALARWYDQHHRDLPWRKTRDPYRIWISEVMLQQTRVSAVLPYYQRFLERFPTVEALAAAAEADLLAAWAGLGYYSRARNLQRAAKQIVAQGGFPRHYDQIRALSGVGDYTAAAIASIAFHLPYAVLDGNVMRVLARLDNDPSDITASATRKKMQQRVQQLLDPDEPAKFNQAMMELGATICLPKQPQCGQCPVQTWCEARHQGTQNQLPVKGRKQRSLQIERVLLIVERKGAILLWRRGPESPKLQGFWELPEAGQLPSAKLGKPLGEFRHSIVNHNYRVFVVPATLTKTPAGFQWLEPSRLRRAPLSTMARKALALAGRAL
ncbi:MAG: A/G-specific adenine glycosylase [Bryobacteraceae bacterium]|nr:A/G-specific adenine glycosylase [Bryobacteraceae bacterium]MDW8379337.1 A/G-specific adenine glycosylase [Bryobacterales bacterium]